MGSSSDNYGDKKESNPSGKGDKEPHVDISHPADRHFGSLEEAKKYTKEMDEKSTQNSGQDDTTSDIHVTPDGKIVGKSPAGYDRYIGKLDKTEKDHGKSNETNEGDGKGKSHVDIKSDISEGIQSVSQAVNAAYNNALDLLDVELPKELSDFLEKFAQDLVEKITNPAGSDAASVAYSAITEFQTQLIEQFIEKNPVPSIPKGQILGIAHGFAIIGASLDFLVSLAQGDSVSKAGAIAVGGYIGGWIGGLALGGLSGALTGGALGVPGGIVGAAGGGYIGSKVAEIIANGLGLPLILDLDGDGIELISARDSNAFFNYGNMDAKSATTGQEYVVRTGWVGADDGILVYDFDDSNTVNDPFEIVFTKYLQGAKTDLEGLRGLDDNKDGKLDDKDKAWAKFKIWQDKNQNGIVDQGEMVAASAFGLAFINLTGDGKASVQNGNLIAQHAEYGTIDGQIHQLGDVGFGFELQLYERGQVKDAGLSSGNHSSGQVEVHVADSTINNSPKLDDVHSPVTYQDGVFSSVTPPLIVTPTASNLGVPSSPPSVAPQPLPPEGGSPVIENGPLISEKPGVQVQGPKEVVVFQPGGGTPEGDTGDDNNSGGTPLQDYRLPASASNDAMEGIEDQTLSFSADDLLKNDRTDYGHLEIIGIDHVKGGRVEWVSPSAPFGATSPNQVGGGQPTTPTSSNLGVPGSNITATPGPTNPTRLGASGDGAEQATPSVPSGATSPASEGGESGHYVFIPDEDFEGEASFDYWIRDEAGNVSQASAKIDIKGVNDAPLAKEALYVTMQEDGARSFALDQLLKPILDKDGDVAGPAWMGGVKGRALRAAHVNIH